MLICWWGNSGGFILYAYQQEQLRRREYANLYVVPHNQRVNRVHKAVQKQVKKKRVNPILHAIRLSVVFSLLSAYMYFIFPTCFNNLIRNVFFPPKVSVNTDMPKGYAFNDMINQGGADLYSISNPTANYLSNDLFLNRMLVTPTVQ